MSSAVARDGAGRYRLAGRPLTPRRPTLEPMAELYAPEQPPDAERPTRRHRAAGNLGPVRIAAIAAAVLVTLGVGAVVVPALLSSGPSSRPPATGGGALPVDSAVPSDSASPEETPTPGPTSSPRTTTTARGAPKINIGRAESTVVELVNEERRRAGCDRVRNNGDLHDVARKHSMDMATTNRLSHTGSDGSSPQDRMRAGGYRNPGNENIASGYQTPQDVVDAWMHNRGNRDNIIDCQAKAIGVGLWYSRDGTPYWTQDLGR
jgi:uncharacterized protein YkwD